MPSSVTGAKRPCPPLRYAVEYKLDGLTINLTYRGGQLVEAATRGNGEVGEAILPQARTIRCVPLSIPYQGLLEVQGECIMRLSTLEAYNKTADEPLKNARNAAAGALRNLDPAVTARRKLDAFFYQIGTIENPPYHDLDGMIAFLQENGFPTSRYEAHATTYDEIVQRIDAVEAQRESLDFLIDGAVVKVCDLQTRQAMGNTEKFPPMGGGIQVCRRGKYRNSAGCNLGAGPHREAHAPCSSDPHRYWRRDGQARHAQ